jgi:hypothetical protein
MAPVDDIIATALQRRREQLEVPPTGDENTTSATGAQVDDSNIDPTLHDPAATTSSASLRRPRSDSESESPEERGRKNARFVEGVCNRYGLSGPRRNMVQDFSKAGRLFLLNDWKLD